MFQLLKALQYIHSQKIVHRDIKLGNLFLTEKMELKVGDFGLAVEVQDDVRRRTMCGTPNYIAPEVLDSNIGHSYQCDIWAVGVIMFAMIIGKPPFETPEVKSTYARIKKNEYEFPNESGRISLEAKDLI